MVLSLGGIIAGVVIALVVIVLVVAFVKAYNKLVELRNKVKNGWSQIDVQLKRRFDLLPNLAETVKGYASHEKEIWDAFAEARGSYTRATQSDSVEAAAQANQSLGQALSRLLIVQEKYPELKANSNFQSMMAELRETEDKIQYARQFYNDVVLKYNNKVEMFPSNIVAKMFNFKVAEFFEVANADQKEAPQIKF
mgnify:CR=1 FL=1